MEKLFHDLPDYVSDAILLPVASRYFDEKDLKKVNGISCPFKYTPEQRTVFRTFLSYLKLVMKIRTVSPSIALSLQKSGYWDDVLKKFLNGTKPNTSASGTWMREVCMRRDCIMCRVRKSIECVVSPSLSSNEGSFIGVIQWLMRISSAEIASKERSAQKWGLCHYAGTSMKELHKVALSYRHSLEEIVLSNGGTVSKSQMPKFALGKRCRNGRTKEENLPPEDFLLLKISWSRTMGITKAIEDKMESTTKRDLLRKSSEAYDQTKKKRENKRKKSLTLPLAHVLSE